jgi:hypothetical protein
MPYVSTNLFALYAGHFVISYGKYSYVWVACIGYYSPDRRNLVNVVLYPTS